MIENSHALLHIGLIMDGNGRWATNQNLPRLAGHAAGVETLMDIVRTVPGLGIGSMTLFAFAIANWKRNQVEVDGLWELFDVFFDKHATELVTENVRLRVIGNRTGLPLKILQKVEKIESQSQDNTGLLLQIALNYDGLDEVARLVQRAMEAGVQPAEITPAYIQTHLDTLPGTDPDIVIRTGMPENKKTLSVWRSSAFLPLQSAQSVCVGTEVLWPDFTIEHLKEIVSYADPDERLFGGQRKEV